MITTDELLARLDEIEDHLEREVRDTHDYSSANYSAFDDGYNKGVYDALEHVRMLLHETQ